MSIKSSEKWILEGLIITLIKSIVKMIELLKNPLREIVLGWSPTYHFYSYLREHNLLRKYRRRREYYNSICRENGLMYNEREIIGLIRNKIEKRGYNSLVKEMGDIHTFAIIPRLGWHGHLFDDLYKLGPVTEFDYVEYGYNVLEFYKADTHGRRRRLEMNSLILPAVKRAQERHPIDWVFVYANGTEVSANTIRQIQDEVGVPVVNMCFDDKQSWDGKWLGDHRGNQIDIAEVYDVIWTSARVVCDWYLAEGGRPIYMPEGCNTRVFRPIPISQDIPVSFVGGNYGFRKRAIRLIERNGVDVQTFGQGWKAGLVGDEELVKIICRSRINLGLGGIGYSEWLTNVKGRDFEIPCTGGGLYLTSYNPDLALHFDIGKEIVCYRTHDEIVELIRYYLAHSDEAVQIARRGRERCLREHRWLHRYIRICQVLGILK
jgi:spore maturation protein CgeB